MTKYDLAGQRFNRWTALYRVPGSRYMCRCDCGTLREVTTKRLVSDAESCGCAFRDRPGWNRSHGLSRGPSREMYMIWRGMLRRCYDEQHVSYSYYGGRGIGVADEWQDDPQAFIDYMPPRPSRQYSIDRINNDGDYEPGNVRWATRSEQMLNRRPNLGPPPSRPRWDEAAALRREGLTWVQIAQQMNVTCRTARRWALAVERERSAA